MHLHRSTEQIDNGVLLIRSRLIEAVHLCCWILLWCLRRNVVGMLSSNRRGTVVCLTV